MSGVDVYSSYKARNVGRWRIGNNGENSWKKILTSLSESMRAGAAQPREILDAVSFLFSSELKKESMLKVMADFPCS